MLSDNRPLAYSEVSYRPDDCSAISTRGLRPTPLSQSGSFDFSTYSTVVCDRHPRGLETFWAIISIPLLFALCWDKNVTWIAMINLSVLRRMEAEIRNGSGEKKNGKAEEMRSAS